MHAGLGGFWQRLRLCCVNILAIDSHMLMPMVVLIAVYMPRVCFVAPCKLNYMQLGDGPVFPCM